MKRKYIIVNKGKRINYICRRCNTLAKMHRKYKSLYCDGCNQWLEASCKDPRCKLCSKRPLRPLMLKTPKLKVYTFIGKDNGNIKNCFKVLGIEVSGNLMHKYR